MSAVIAWSFLIGVGALILATSGAGAGFPGPGKEPYGLSDRENVMRRASVYEAGTRFPASRLHR